MANLNINSEFNYNNPQQPSKLLIRLVKLHKTINGKLVERLNTPVLKTGSPSRGSRVRIPRFPPLIWGDFLTARSHKVFSNL